MLGVLVAHGYWSPVSHVCTGKDCGMGRQSSGLMQDSGKRLDWEGVEGPEQKRLFASETEMGLCLSPRCSVPCPQVCAAASCDGQPGGDAGCLELCPGWHGCPL